MIWFGYFFTVLNYVCYCLSRFMKHKRMMLLLDLLAKVFTALGLYFLDSLSGAYIFIAVFFMLIVANIKERLNKKLPQQDPLTGQTQPVVRIVKIVYS